jgi:hypothetical protein
MSRRYKECAAFKKGKGKRREATLILLFIYFSLSLILLSIPDSRRNPSPRPASPFSVTGAFSPGLPDSSHSARGHPGLALDLLQLSSRFTTHSPALPPVYQMELPDVSLIPHRISSSSDWRPAPLFVPASSALARAHRLSPI